MKIPGNWEFGKEGVHQGKRHRENCEGGGKNFAPRGGKRQLGLPMGNSGGVQESWALERVARQGGVKAEGHQTGA